MTRRRRSHSPTLLSIITRAIIEQTPITKRLSSLFLVLGASSISELACRSDSRAWQQVSPLESLVMLAWEEPLNNQDYSSVWFLSWFSLRSWVFMAWSWPSTYTPNKRKFTNVAIILSFNPSSKSFRSVWRSNKRDDSQAGGLSLPSHAKRRHTTTDCINFHSIRTNAITWRPHRPKTKCKSGRQLEKGRVFTGLGSRA